MTFQELKKTMEATRAHLQKELRSRDMECERLSIHIKVPVCLDVGIACIATFTHSLILHT